MISDGIAFIRNNIICIVIQGDESSTEIFDGVMICTGHHVYPHIPYIDGIEDFRGTKLHSHDYKTPEPFTNKRVLIVGKCCIKQTNWTESKLSFLVIIWFFILSHSNACLVLTHRQDHYTFP